VCYPEAEQPYHEFLEAMDQFKIDIHSILVDNGQFSEVLPDPNYCDYGGDLNFVYVHPQSLDAVKVTIECMMDHTKYGQESVHIL